jgi:hypothetical protein
MGGCMIRVSEMVRANGSPMKVVKLGNDGIAECLLIDGDGIARFHFVPVEQLKPMWQSLQPRSLWPETNAADLLEVEREERVAKEAALLKKKRARRARRSNKIKLGQ